jgi:hypothetical protein
MKVHGAGMTFTIWLLISVSLVPSPDMQHQAFADRHRCELQAERINSHGVRTAWCQPLKAERKSHG